MSPAILRAFPRRRLLFAVLACAAAAEVRAQSDGIANPQMDPLPRLPRTMIFFPPIPPPLDRPVARASALPPTHDGPPAALAPYLGEFFYPQLGSRLLKGKLPPRLQQELEAYDAAKRVVQRDLAAEVKKQRAADAPTREAAFAALARRQALSLAQLEKQAEQLRRDLVDPDRDWNDQREWHLGDTERRGYSPYEIAQVMRAYAYYVPGLSIAQRRLLLEITVDLATAAEDPTKAAAAQPYLFFSPEPARVMLPDDITPEVAAKIAAYQTKKSALKKDLYNAVYKYDGAALPFFNNSLRHLADRQAAGFVELERLAEEIRRLMVAHPPRAKAAEKSPLPAALMARVSALLRQRATIQREAAAQADAIIASHADAPVRAGYRFDEDGLKFIVVPMRGGRGRRPDDEDRKTADAVSQELAAVAEEYGRRLADFINERAATRKDVGAALATTNDIAIDNALGAAARIYQDQENAAGYEFYRVALFEPGLSIEQRRLLLDDAVQRLDLPLPRGDLQPGRRDATW